EDGNTVGSLGTDGLLCIGLPTLLPTGTPLWVDAHFHGNISRTEVYWNQPYNQQLLDEAVSLVADLVTRLKVDESLVRRRLAALALEPGSTARSTFLGKKLYGSDGLAAGPVILSSDGSSFVRAADLALPAREDQQQFERLVADAEEAAA